MPGVLGMNYSLRTLLIVATGFAIVFASLAYPTAIVGDLFYTFALLVIAFGSIAALYFRGQRRAYWVGFLILFGGYFCHSVWPSEIRSTWLFLQRGGNLGYASQGIVTSRLLGIAYEGLHDPMGLRRTIRSPRMPSYPAPEETAGQYVAFMTTGHVAIGLMIGIAGGLVAQRLASQTLPLMKRPIEKILRDIESQETPGPH